MPKEFKLKSKFKPTDAQNESITKISDSLKKGNPMQTLLGITGSGKSLDSQEIIIIKDSKGYIKKVNIGDFVNGELGCIDVINDTLYKNIKGPKILSFNNSNFSKQEKQITQVSKHKEKNLFEITLDDGSKIRLTKDHNCFRLNDDLKLDLVDTLSLKEGDVLPLSNKIISGEGVKVVNLIDFSKHKKLNIIKLLNKYDPKGINLKAYLKNHHNSPGWKVKQILAGTKDRGLSYEHLLGYLNSLKLKLGDVLDHIEIINFFGGDVKSYISFDDDFLTFLGLYVSEGHNTGKYTLISNSDSHLKQRCISFAKHNSINYYVRNENDVVYYSIFLSNFLKIFGSKALEKRIPSLIYNLSNKQLSVFLKAMFDGDGWSEESSCCYSSSSNELIFDLKRLLLRYGIISRIRRKKTKGALNYVLSISGQNNLKLFKNNIGFSIGYKSEKLDSNIGFNSNTNVDLVYNSSDFIKFKRMGCNLSQKELGNIMGVNSSYISMLESGHRTISKNKFQKFVDYLIKKSKTYSYLKNTLDFNLRVIKSIKMINSTDGYVYDIAVKDNENFMAGDGDFFVHNTFMAANIIQNYGRPTLVLAHNKTLAAQLYSELKEFFPDNAVEYFVSYYDYYQPESYMAATDTYIEKDSSINAKIEQMRLAATTSLLTRKDVIIVASISCIYGIGNPDNYRKVAYKIEKGEEIPRHVLLGKFLRMQYERNDLDLKPGTFRVKGDVIDIIPGYDEHMLIRIEMFGDDIESIGIYDPVNMNKKHDLDKVVLFPARHFIIEEDEMKEAVEAIKEELEEHLPNLPELEAHRLKQRTNYDLEMIEEMGYCNGIENYSRYFDKRRANEPPHCLLDYMGDNFLLIIDESHQTIPQSHGMYKGDQSRKKSLIDYGFRLPSAYDNRPLRFEEFQTFFKHAVFVSATPGDYEVEQSKVIAEQIIRPTGLLDPKVTIKKTKGQMDDLKSEIAFEIENDRRVLVTTLTKRMAEQLTEYLGKEDIKVRYLHSEIDTLERTEILRQLRAKEFDVLVGINLLREGIDLPEVGLVAILDADKEGFLRNERSLVQTIGRAARNSNGRVIMYADTQTISMKNAIKKTHRRRELQNEYNKEHGITPKTIIKAIPEKKTEVKDLKHMPKSELPKEIAKLEKRMKQASSEMDFELAIELRDRILKLKEHQRSRK